MPKTSNTPAGLAAFAAHGVDFTLSPSGSEANGDCPFCKAEGKWYSSADEGLWSCKSCQEKGNPIIFLRKLWELSPAPVGSLAELASDRGLSSVDGLESWGVRQSLISGEWIIPGCNQTGAIVQLYRYAEFRGHRTLLATSGIQGHGLFGVKALDRKKGTVYLCEGPWDGLSLLENLRAVKYQWSKVPGQPDPPLVPTGNPAASLGATSSVLSVPGCGSFSADWAPLFAGKDVCIMFDNDHPKKNKQTGADLPPAGYEGAKRTAGTLFRSSPAPRSIRYLSWGEDGKGFNPDIPDGYDVRDFLNQGD